MDRDPALSEAAFGLGLICFEQRRYGEAALRFRAAVAAGCRNGLVHVGLGQSLFFLGDFAAAARELALQIASGAADVTLIRRHALACYLDIAISGEIDAAESAYARPPGPRRGPARPRPKPAFQIFSAYGHREAR